MGALLNPNGDNRFVRLFNVRQTDLFVDKTDFIREPIPLSTIRVRSSSS